ncbi:hypothetical protein FGB62_98g032 [Gracilaria domingensis]|nr:hypothetical protein FGB62_98g032 [Gracilaria domingensis]
MNGFTSRVSSRVFPETDPGQTVSIKVGKKALQSATDNSIRKRNWYERYIPLPSRRRIFVEACECGTTDSILFAPERPNVQQSHQRVSATEFIKVSQDACADVVRRDDDFEVSFVGLSVAQQDYIGDNEMLLCSLARKQDHHEVSQSSSTAASSSTGSTSGTAEHLDTSVPGDSITEEGFQKAKLRDGTVPIPPKTKKIDLSDLPTALPIRPGDIPFLHFDPETDGHDSGSEPDTFVPIPGTKRLFIQRRGSLVDGESEGMRDVSVRFTVMEIDKLNEEQLIAIKSLEEVAKSVGKAASSVPYLKFISWLLKFANTVGRSALRKVARPDHVMSSDVSFMLGEPRGVEKGDESYEQREEYGNYLRVSTECYCFSCRGIDFPSDVLASHRRHEKVSNYVILYRTATGASTQNVQLLLHRHGYRARNALLNEKEYFPLTGVSYVVVKVTRGCSPYDMDQRRDMFERHRGRLTQLLKKYTGTLGSMTAEAAADGQAAKDGEKKPTEER